MVLNLLEWFPLPQMGIPLRNDENHVCARAAQPPRVALYKALGGFATVR